MLTKEEFEKLTENEKNMLKSFFEQPKEADKDKDITNPKVDDTVKPDTTSGDKELDKKVTEPKPAVPNNEPADPKPSNEDKSNENDQNNKNDINKVVAEAINNAIKPLLEANEELKKELKEIKSKSPIANYNPKPSDKTISAREQKDLEFIERYKARYRN